MQPFFGKSTIPHLHFNTVFLGHTTHTPSCTLGVTADQSVQFRYLAARVFAQPTPCPEVPR